MKSKLSISLSEQDWSDLANFVAGDLANMDEACPVAAQMRGIVEMINTRVAYSIARRSLKAPSTGPGATPAA